MERGPRRPGPGRGTVPGTTCLPRWSRGQGALSQVVAHDRAPVCPGGAGGKAPWPRSWRSTGRPSAPVERGQAALSQFRAQVRAPVCPGGPGARRPGPGRGPFPGARLPRWTGGQGALAQVVAHDREPVCPGGPGGKAPWPRSRPRSGRPSAPVERGQAALSQVGAQVRGPVCPGGPGARRPGPGQGPGPGPGPGARLPRWTGGPGDLARVVAQDRAPVCPGGPGWEEGLRFWQRRWCRNIQYGGPSERGSANFSRGGVHAAALTKYPGDRPGVPARALVQLRLRLAYESPGIRGTDRGDRPGAPARALAWLEAAPGSRCQCRGQAGRAFASTGKAG